VQTSAAERCTSLQVTVSATDDSVPLSGAEDVYLFRRRFLLWKSSVSLAIAAALIVMGVTIPELFSEALVLVPGGLFAFLLAGLFGLEAAAAVRRLLHSGPALALTHHGITGYGFEGLIRWEGVVAMRPHGHYAVAVDLAAPLPFRVRQSWVHRVLALINRRHHGDSVVIGGVDLDAPANRLFRNLERLRALNPPSLPDHLPPMDVRRAQRDARRLRGGAQPNKELLLRG
jgi:hypothetical protein